MKDIVKTLLSILSPFVSWVLVCLFLSSTRDIELMQQIANVHLYVYTGFLLILYISLIINVSSFINCLVEKYHSN